MTVTKLTAEQALEIATTTAADRATVSIYHGPDGGDAIRVTGCFIDEGREVVMDVARAAGDGRVGCDAS